MKAKVVILLSDKRSGSTMLRETICQHPEIQHVAYSPHTYFETQYWLNSSILLGSDRSLFASNRKWKSSAVSKLLLHDLMSRNVPSFAGPSNTRSLVFEGWEALCGCFAQPVFFEKSPHHLCDWAALSLILEWYHSTNFEVKFLALVRHPFSVMLSALKLFGTNPESRQYTWLNCYRNLLAFRQLLPSDAIHLLKYEDLVAKPSETLRSVYDFIDLPAPEHTGAGVHTMSLENWREQEQFSFLFDPAVVQMASYFGYNLLTNDIGNRQLRELPHPGLIRRLRSRLRHRVLEPIRIYLGQYQ